MEDIDRISQVEIAKHRGRIRVETAYAIERCKRSNILLRHALRMEREAAQTKRFNRAAIAADNAYRNGYGIDIDIEDVSNVVAIVNRKRFR